MTWTKTGVEFPAQCADAGLSDAAYRTHHEMITALYTLDRDDVTDLRMSKRQLRRYVECADAETAIKELAAAGFWRDDGEHWVLVHHADVVRTSLYAQRAKLRRDREAQRAHRAKEKGLSADVSADVSAPEYRQTDSHLREGELSVTSAAAFEVNTCIDCNSETRFAIAGRCRNCHSDHMAAAR
jgi:hypothetical protein